jgi:hypothetical protein
MLLAAAVRAADVDRGFFCEACRIHRMLQYHCFKVREKSLEDLKHAAKARETIQASNKHACIDRPRTLHAACNTRSRSHKKLFVPSKTAPGIINTDQIHTGAKGTNRSSEAVRASKM